MSAITPTVVSTPSHEPPPAVGVLERLDAALLDLRRFTEPKRRPAFVTSGAGERVEMSTVLVVHTLASSPDGCDIRGVADALHVAHSTASRLVERACQAGTLTRARDPHDPRRTNLALTEAGRALNAEAVRFRVHHLGTVLAGWSAEDTATLTTLLERFAADANRDTGSRTPSCTSP